MSAVFGIDLGTTNSVIARLDQGRPVPIPIDGSPIVPSVVLWEDDRTVVGREARNLELLFPERTVRSVKRRMGQEYRYRMGDRELSPEEVSAEILGALKRGAEQATGERVQDLVITVPAYFDDAQRRATLRAGELAGLNVLRLLNEPTSAALVYEQVGRGGAGEAPEILMVYDLGGGTFDVSILEVFAGVREVRATTGNTALGGDDFDEKLVQLFLDHLKAGGVNPHEDARAMARLRRLAEDTKIRLSQETAVQVHEEFLTSHGGKPVHLDLEVSRRQFEALIGPLLQTTIDLARQAVRDARLGTQALQRICLVGGSTRIPLVRALLQEAFAIDVHEEIDPDLAVGLGAAIQSGLLQGAPLERILVDVTSHSLGIRVIGEDDDPYFDEEPDTFAPVLRRNTALPAARSEEFYTLADGQKKLQVEVFQGEAPRASENTRVGSFDFPLLSRPANSPVRVEFQYDLNGVVKVTASQAGTDNAKTVAMAVADAAAVRQGAPAEPIGPVERKARRLLESLTGATHKRLQKLLDSYSQAQGPQREQAEDALLDFILTLEDEEE